MKNKKKIALVLINGHAVLSFEHTLRECNHALAFILSVLAEVMCQYSSESPCPACITGTHYRGLRDSD